MSITKCRLCGGRLSDNKCTFCGLDNSIYHREKKWQHSLNRREAEHLKRQGRQPDPSRESFSKTVQPSQSRTAKKEKPKQDIRARTPRDSTARQTRPPKTNQTAAQSASRAAYDTQKKAGKKKRVFRRSLAVILLLCLLPSLLDLGKTLIGNVTSSLEDTGWSLDNIWSNDPSPEEDYSDVLDAIRSYDPETYKYDPYEHVTEEIPETGEEFETVLGSGCYMVGVHIPAGVYTAELVDGSGILSGEHTEYLLYDSVYFGLEPDYDQVTIREDLRLYNGERVDIDSGLIVRLTTANAQPLEQEPTANPLNEPVILAEGTYVVGDGVIPEGMFDIFPDTSGDGQSSYASIDLNFSNGISVYYWIDSPETAITSDEYTDTSTKNIVFSEGTEVVVEYGGVILEPSEGYYNVDYKQYSQ